MSLQGSLDTFALRDVLVLLAGTTKSGELQVAGIRAGGSPVEGRLCLADGRLAGSDVPRADSVTDAIFELLRLVEGTFSFSPFSPGATPTPGRHVERTPVEVEPALTDAEGRLAEWRQIEQVVPSLAAQLELVPEPPAEQVTMGAGQWRLVTAIGGGGAVGDVIGRLGLGELPGCRAVKELVEAGLVTLSAEAPATEETLGHDDGSPVITVGNAPEEADDGAPDTSGWSSASDGAFDRRARNRRRMDHFEVAAAALSSPPATEPTGWVGAPEWVPDMDNFEETDRGGISDDVGGDAASAGSRATLRASGGTGASGGTAWTEVASDADEPLNRGLLLKFFSSVRN